MSASFLVDWFALFASTTVLLWVVEAAQVDGARLWLLIAVGTMSTTVAQRICDGTARVEEAAR